MVRSGLVGFRVLVVAIMGAGASTLAAETAFDSIEYLRNHGLVPTNRRYNLPLTRQWDTKVLLHSDLVGFRMLASIFSYRCSNKSAGRRDIVDVLGVSRKFRILVPTTIATT